MNRNIIFVGKTRSGKSTCLNVLKYPFTFVKLSSLFSETVEASINHFTVELQGDNNEKFNFNISIIDTPGLFEVSDKGTQRDNDALEEVVLKCMNSEITKIHMIFFVVAYGSQGINPQDIEALEKFIKLFDGAQSHVHVLITKAEKLSDSDKQKIEKDFRSFPKMQELLKIVNPKMFFIGAVEASDYDQGFVDSFKSSMSNVLNLRQDLFLHIFQKETFFELNALKMVDKVRDHAAKLFVDIQRSFAKKEEITSLDIFKTNCKKLGGWLPLLDPTNYNAANSLLLECEEFVRLREKK